MASCRLYGCQGICDTDCIVWKPEGSLMLDGPTAPDFQCASDEER